MAIFKRPQHRGGKRPPLGELNRYLAKEERRENLLFLDGNGREITAEQATLEAGGYRAEHWHGIIAPSANECEGLTKKHGGNREKAAVEHGKALAARLQTELGSPKKPNVAIHFETGKDGRPRWHYHLVGEGQAHGRLFGKDGILSRSWDRELHPDRKPILDWAEQWRFLGLKKELRTVIQEQRSLSRERYLALREAPRSKQQAVRDRFMPREVDLIHRRHRLEIGCAQARYAARGDLGSSAHRTELERVDLRKQAALARTQYRGQDRQAVRRITERTGRAISSAKRQAVRGAQVLIHAAKEVHQAAREAGGQPGQPRRGPDPLRQLASLAHAGNRAVLALAEGTVRAGLEASRSAVMASAKVGARTATASVKMAVGLLAAVPTKGLSLKESGKEAGKDLATGAREASQELAQGTKTLAVEAAHTGGKVLESAGSLGVGMLPKQVQETLKAGISAIKTATVTTKDLVTLDLQGAAGNLLAGGLETSKHLGQAVLSASKELPAVVRLPMKTAEMAPMIGLPIRALRTLTELGASTAKSIELDR